MKRLPVVIAAALLLIASPVHATTAEAEVLMASVAAVQAYAALPTPGVQGAMAACAGGL